MLATGPWSDVCPEMFHAGPFQSDRARPKWTGRERERRPVECNPEMAGNAQAPWGKNQTGIRPGIVWYHIRPSDGAWPVVGCSAELLDSQLTHTYSGLLHCYGDSGTERQPFLVVQLIMSPRLSISVCRCRLRPFACPTRPDTRASGKMTIADLPATWAACHWRRMELERNVCLAVNKLT